MKKFNFLFIFIVFTMFSLKAQTFTDIDAGILPIEYNASSAWGDYDNDTYLDLIICGEPQGGVDTTLLYHNNGNGTFSVVEGTGLMEVSTGDLEWGDFNNDNYIDLLIMGYANDAPQLKLYINNQDGTFTEQMSTGLPGGLYLGDLDFADFNNDGYLDIGLCGMDDTWVFITKIFENMHDLTFTELAGLNLEGLNFGTFKWGDYDGDTYPDFVINGFGDASFVTELWKNSQNETFTEQTSVSLRQCWLGDMAWGDYDNDNDLDLFLSGTGGDGTERATLIYTNNNDGTFTEEATSLPAVSHSSLELADFDGDGDLDLFISGTTDAMGTGNYIGEIRYNDAGDFSSSEYLPKTYWGQCKVADFDNNSFPDIFICGYDDNENAFSEIYKNDRTVSVETLASKDILVSPVPASDYLNILGKETISKIEIIDITGKKLLSNNLNKKDFKIDISKFNKGYYILNIHQDSGTTTKKIIIK